MTAFPFMRCVLPDNAHKNTSRRVIGIIPPSDTFKITSRHLHPAASLAGRVSLTTSYPFSALFAGRSILSRRLTQCSSRTSKHGFTSYQLYHRLHLAAMLIRRTCASTAISLDFFAAEREQRQPLRPQASRRGAHQNVCEEQPQRQGVPVRCTRKLWVWAYHDGY